MLDKVRLADGIPVPESMIIIGLLANNATLKPGSDFYSRFDVVEACPVAEAHLNALLLPLPELGASTEHKICLYGSMDWKAKLVGRWVAQGGRWFYEEGCLRDVLMNSPERVTLTIQNGLWEDPEFVTFWQDALQRGQINTPSGPILLPEGISLIRNEDYDWDRLSARLTVLEKPPEQYVVLNSSTYNQLLRRYIVKDHYLEASNGLIQEATNASLVIYLTHELAENQWAELLSSANHHNVTLHVYCAPGITLPIHIAGLFATGEPPGCKQSKYLKVNSWPEFIIIESTDVEVTVAQRLKEKPNSLTIDVSELNPADLLTKITVERSPTQFRFTETPCILNTSNQPIILRGRFSAALAETLAPMLMKQPKLLTLISEDTSILAYSNQRVKHHAFSLPDCKYRDSNFTS